MNEPVNAPGPVWIAVTTVSTADDAATLARMAVERGLAACVQIEAIRSIYDWQGRLCDDCEHRLTFKTSANRLRALSDAVHQAHPYDLPQWLAWPAQASAGYGRWVESGGC